MTLRVGWYDFEPSRLKLVGKTAVADYCGGYFGRLILTQATASARLRTVGNLWYVLEM